MYNLAKLSAASQIFLKTVSGCNTTDLAVGKAIASKLPLPSFEVASIQQHYMLVVEAMARETVSNLNEIVMIDARAVLSYVEMFWKVRYITVFPQTNAVFGAGDAVGTFMGYGNIIPLKTYEDIKENLVKLMRDVHGFNQIVEELSVNPDAVPTETSTDLIATDDTVSSESYSGTRRRHALAGA